MTKAARILLGVLLVCLILYLAKLATRDCTIGIYAYDLCLWVWIREQFGLPASKLLRACVLEVVGLALATGIYLTIRYVFPPWRRPAAASGEDRSREPS